MSADLAIRLSAAVLLFALAIVCLLVLKRIDRPDVGGTNARMRRVLRGQK
jgi:hypothetical protein